jgi:hypothetical protein
LSENFQDCRDVGTDFAFKGVDNDICYSGLPNSLSCRVYRASRVVSKNNGGDEYCSFGIDSQVDELMNIFKIR